MCFAPGESIDFLDRDDELIENDTVSSISIPNGMLATIYKNDNYNLPYLNLMESIGQRDLADLDMDNQISNVKVSNSPIEGCSKRCVILNRMQLPLSDIFAQNWDDPNYPNKQVLLSFDINDQSVFMTELSLGPIIWFSNRDLFIFNNPQNSEPLVFRIHPDANRFSLLFHLNNNRIAVDYMESHGTEQIALSPTITVAHAPFDRPVETSAIIINNTGKHPLIIDQVVMAASAEDIRSIHHRSERDTAGTLGCTFIPALAIYNYVTHSRCNQGDTLWSKVTHWFSDKNKDKPVLVTANPTLLKPQPQQPENSGGAALILTQIQTQLHNQALTLPATAQFCKTSIDNILASRYPRDVDMHCPLWVSRVLADFTLLFGDSMRDWTLDVLRRVITQIYESDTTGFATSDPAAESRLVNEVREVIRGQGQDETIHQISQAFEYTRLNYARYRAHTPTTAVPPAAAQRLPLGTYSLALASYHHPTEPPVARVRENGEWVTHPDLYFDVDILDTTIPDQPGVDEPLMDDARAALAAWSDIYNAAPVNYHITNEYWSEHDRTIEAGRAHSYSLYSEMLAPDNDYIYVAVRLGGDIVSLLAARRDESFENSDENYYIEFFVTDPNYVLMPEDEESVRGAGRAAVQGIAQYLQQRGVKTLRFRAISQPAARVSTKLGFHHDEF
ncbi:GNAT family N-acetyltransferase [Yersinia enterocolitica]|uniref:GNAT family N-acetyltransferase n=1 Tax=Yersinia enterocolitica TaxID=630 RepID=UPI001C60CC6F|nr:GNAT family N-acetyltransferase [Yersinia enterocolitica]MBW5838335.1 GNAT family N-acetyltransferase [Yersinia enterocolitica]MBW5856494.1 GNAT family N-acetyltransferase [Yersinia enterocolitica]MBW5860087.1 GNAT family N-acetyltransferase [Yersinia enterocolitica]MBW5873435.1 GNAT family N-acetyltransferase [Yersinia enterocolitica]